LEEQDKQKRASRKGRQDGTSRKGLPGKDCLDRILQQEKDRQDRTARKGQPEQDRRNKTATTGQPGHEPGQNCQYRAARIGLPVQDCKD
jgi:hypothetical protein